MIHGGVMIVIDDRSTSIEMVGGGSWTIPVGPHSLVEHELERAARPSPEQLVNALGIVSDHLDDVVRESPIVAHAPVFAIAGRHAHVLACVEVGNAVVPTGFALERTAVDEVFRTLVAEPVAERVHNPGLPAADVETVIGTCCVVLAVMRRLELTSIDVMLPAESPGWGT